MYIYLLVQKDLREKYLIYEVIAAYTDLGIAQTTADSFNQSKNEFDGEYVVNTVFLCDTQLEKVDDLDEDLDLTWEDEYLGD